MENKKTLNQVCKEFIDWTENHVYLEDFYDEDKVSNCCGARVINGVCQDCKEHCEEVETE